MNNILITSAGRRVSLLRHFKEVIQEFKLDSKIYITDLHPALAPTYYFADGVLNISPTKSDSFVIELLNECLEKGIKLIIPTSDLELEKLSSQIELFKENGITILISNFNLIMQCRNKRLTDNLFEQIGINVIPKQDKAKLEFPVFVKPFDGSLSKGIALYHTANEIPPGKFAEENLIWMPYFSPDEFQEYTVDCYYDKTGALKCLVPRLRIEVRGGEISKGKTVGGKLYSQLISAMKKVKGARGCITLQIFASKKDLMIFGIEINPRFGGGFPLSYHAGANFPLYILKEYLMDESIDFFDGWKIDKYMVRYDQEIIFDL